MWDTFFHGFIIDIFITYLIVLWNDEIFLILFSEIFLIHSDFNTKPLAYML